MHHCVACGRLIQEEELHLLTELITTLDPNFRRFCGPPGSVCARHLAFCLNSALQQETHRAERKGAQNPWRLGL